MKVIVAGVPKTGTKSVNAALKELGYEVYDFVENLLCLEREWGDIFETGWTTQKFYDMYKDVDAVVDVPTAIFWEEIHKAFPDSQIILTVRDSDEVWLNSIKHHYKTVDENILGRILQVMEVLLRRNTGFKLLATSYGVLLNIQPSLLSPKTHLNESLLKMKYRAHNAYVMQNAPPGKLLVFNCKQGWEPLCNFLGKSIPDSPFPHNNIRASIVGETASRRDPIIESYKRKLMLDFLKFLAKVILVCSGIVFMYTYYLR